MSQSSGRVSAAWPWGFCTLSTQSPRWSTRLCASAYIALPTMTRHVKAMEIIHMRPRTNKQINKQGLLKAYDCQCCFADLLGLSDSGFVTLIKDKQSALRGLYEKAPAATKSETKYKMIHKFKDFMLENAHKMKPSDVQHCLKHGSCCKLYPDAGENEAWCECVSPSCIHWSSQGARAQWLGSENIPLLVWAISCRVRCADIVHLECTQQLDLEFLTALSAGRLVWFSKVLCPLDIGIPATGRRLWATAATGQFIYKENPYGDCNLTSCVLRKAVGSPLMWCWSTQLQVNAYLDMVNASRDKIPPHPRGKRYRAEDYIGQSYSGRLFAHRLKAVHCRKEEPALTNVPFFFDISQNVHWSRKPTGVLPRPLTGSTIWVESLERPMLPVEVLSAQGIFFV